MKNAFTYLRTKDSQKADLWRKYDPNQYSEKKLITNLSDYCPDISKYIEEYYDKPLNEYLKALWSNKITPLSNYAKNARKHFLTQIKFQLAKTHSEQNLDVILNEFEKNPVFQTGPHCQLITDPATFYTTIFTAMGAHSMGNQYFFNYHCSTITLDGFNKGGPGWIKIGDKAYKVFKDVARKRMAKTAVFALKNINANMDVDILDKHSLAEKKYFDDVSSVINNLPNYNSAVDIFAAGSQKLWSLWNKGTSIPSPIYFNDYFMSELLSIHILDQESFVRRIIFDLDFQAKLESELHLQHQSKIGNMLPKYGFYLWDSTGTKVVPLVFKDGNLYNEKNDYYVPFDPQIISDKLKQGKIFPNLFIVFLMTSILPCYRVLGGLHQLSYYQLWHNALIKTLKKDSGLQSQLLYKDIISETRNAWGFHVFEEPDSICDLLTKYKEGVQISEIINQYSQTTLASTTDNLKPLRVYPRWGQLLCD